MKINKIIKILITALIFIAIFSIKSYGAVAITKGTAVFTNRTISDFYDISREMKNPGQGLEGTNVDVHMATNKEWATVSYFSNSNYGTATQGKNTGINIEIDGVTYSSTNGNATGVMDWGKKVTFTSGVINNYSEITDETIYENGKSIIQNATNDKLVDLINTVSASSIAKNGWYSSWNYLAKDIKYPYSARSGLFGFVGGGVGGGIASGVASVNVTFRPVILN